VIGDAARQHHDRQAAERKQRARRCPARRSGPARSRATRAQAHRARRALRSARSRHLLQAAVRWPHCDPRARQAPRASAAQARDEARRWRTHSRTPRSSRRHRARAVHTGQDAALLPSLHSGRRSGSTPTVRRCNRSRAASSAAGYRLADGSVSGKRSAYGTVSEAVELCHLTSAARAISPAPDTSGRDGRRRPRFASCLEAARAGVSSGRRRSQSSVPPPRSFHFNSAMGAEATRGPSEARREA
jgi:hypothetical protein